MKILTTLSSLALAILIVGAAAAQTTASPTPTAPAFVPPLPAAAPRPPFHHTSSPTGPASQPTPPPPPPPMMPPATVPLSPSDANSLVSLLQLISHEKDLQMSMMQYLTSAQKQIDKMQQDVGDQDKLAQAEIAKIKAENHWGDEVTFNGQSGKFERRVSPPPSASTQGKK
jgi:hypothetical protein